MSNSTRFSLAVAFLRSAGVEGLGTTVPGDGGAGPPAPMPATSVIGPWGPAGFCPGGAMAPKPPMDGMFG